MIAEGQRISGSETLSVPIGAIVQRGSGRYRRIMSGFVRDGEARVRPPGAWHGTGIEVITLPNEQPPIAYDLRRQWVTTTLRGIATQHGGGYFDEAVRRFPQMDALDPEPFWPKGAFIHYGDTRLYTPPDGLAVDFGHQDETGNVVIYRWFGGSWLPVIGMAMPELFVGRIVSNPEHNTVFDPAYQDGDEARISAFDQKVWDVGYRAKTSNSWCETYEACMIVLGMDRQSVVRQAAVPGGVGWTVTSAEAAALPEGTLLVAATGDYAVFVRSGAGNAARTRSLIQGPSDHRQFAQRMVIAHRPDQGGRLSIDLPSHIQLDWCPRGTVMDYAGSQFRKVNEETWETVNGGGTYYRYSFEGSTPKTLVEIPGINVTDPVVVAQQDPF